MVSRVSLTTARPDTVWEKVHPTPKFGSEHLLEKVVEDGNASKPGEAGP